MKMKKEKIRKEKKEPPKVLVQTPSIYLVKVDQKSPQTKKFLQEKIIKQLAQMYPLQRDERINLEFNLEGCQLRFVETLNKKVEDKYYRIYKEMFFSRPAAKILHDELSAVLDYVEYFFKKLGYEISPSREIDTNSKKFTLGILIRDPKKINGILEKYREESKKEIIEKRGNLITRDTNGEFYHKNRPIKFTNKEAIYYLIFECLYENEGLNGFCSYETIDKYLVEHGKEGYDDEKQIKDRIKNGIMNLFRFSNLSVKAPDGKEIIQKVRGKGIILYNPPL